MKQSIVAITGALALLSLTGALGCGDDDGSSGSGVNGKKLISDVTQEDAKNVCRWIEKESASIKPNNEQFCTAAVVSIASDEAECKQLVADCVKTADKAEPEKEEASDCNSIDADDVDSSCDTITVAEYEACVRASLNQLKGTLSGLSCKSAGEEPELGTSTKPAACQKIADECPALLDGVTSDSGDDGDDNQSTTFSCGDGEVVDGDYKCDGFEDCENGKDEQGC